LAGQLRRLPLLCLCVSLARASLRSYFKG
jgi:hypothetical protein